MLPDSPAGPRAGSSQSDTDSYENHILLCPICHTRVDKEPHAHPIDLLRRWKKEHEVWINNLIADALSAVSFAELEVVCEGVASAGETQAFEDLRLTPPLLKMKRNGLTDRVKASISMGLSQAANVRAFLRDYEEMEGDFPNRLIAGFRRRYHLAMADGLQGDALFSHLAAHPSNDIALQAAQLAAVAYLFHSCDLFEP